MNKYKNSNLSVFQTPKFFYILTFNTYSIEKRLKTLIKLIRKLFGRVEEKNHKFWVDIKEKMGFTHLGFKMHPVVRKDEDATMASFQMGTHNVSLL